MIASALQVQHHTKKLAAFCRSDRWCAQSDNLYHVEPAFRLSEYLPDQTHYTEPTITSTRRHPHPRRHIPLRGLEQVERPEVFDSSCSRRSVRLMACPLIVAPLADREWHVAVLDHVLDLSTHCRHVMSASAHTHRRYTRGPRVSTPLHNSPGTRRGPTHSLARTG